MADTEKDQKDQAAQDAAKDEPKAEAKRSSRRDAKLSNGAPARSAEPNTVASGAYTPEDVVAAAGANADKPGDHFGDQSTAALGAIVDQPENTVADDGAVSIKTKAIQGTDLVEVTEDCVQEFYALGAKRPSKRLVAAKGSILTKAQVEALKAEA